MGFGVKSIGAVETFHEVHHRRGGYVLCVIILLMLFLCTMRFLHSPFLPSPSYSDKCSKEMLKDLSAEVCSVAGPHPPCEEAIDRISLSVRISIPLGPYSPSHRAVSSIVLFHMLHIKAIIIARRKRRLLFMLGETLRGARVVSQNTS